MFSSGTSWGSHFPESTNEKDGASIHSRAHGVFKNACRSLRRLRVLRKQRKVFHESRAAEIASTGGNVPDIWQKRVMHASPQGVA
jgi:hypothetical protein